MKKKLDDILMYIGLFGLVLMPILSIFSDIGQSDLELGTATLVSLLVLFFAFFICGYFGNKIKIQNKIA